MAGDVLCLRSANVVHIKASEAYGFSLVAQKPGNKVGINVGYFFKKKNQTTPRPSEHPPVMGEKMSKRSGGIKRLQIQNHFMAFKQVPRCR